MLVLAITLLAMGRICGHDFLWWDDQFTIDKNPYLQSPTVLSIWHFWRHPEWGVYVPITVSAWGLIASFSRVQPDQFGITLNPWFFHAASLFAHLVTALLAMRIFRLLHAGPWPAAMGAILFAIHPLQVEAVAWASGLKDVLAALFGFAAIIQYIHHVNARQNQRRWIARFVAATVFFELAMLSKASAMTLPLMVLAIDRWAIGRRWRDLLPPVVVWLILAIPIAILAMIVQQASNTPATAIWLRPLIACDSLSFYLFKFIWPLRLCVEYSRTPATVISHGWLWWDWIFPVAIGVLLWLGRRHRPVLLAAGVIFVSGCLPTLGLARTLFGFFTTVADHYAYAAMLGPGLALAWLLSVYRGRWLWIGVSAWLALLAVRTFQQAGFWKNDLSLFAHTVEVSPRSYLSYGNLGSAYARTGHPREAIATFRKAIAIRPDYSLAWSNLGRAQAEAGDIDAGLKSAEHSLDLQRGQTMRPSWDRDNLLVGHLLLEQKKFAEAEPFLLDAVRARPGDQESMTMLAEAKRGAMSERQKDEEERRKDEGRRMKADH